MAKKLKKMLNYWFNPENYSIIKSMNNIIDTVNELIDGGGGSSYTLPIATTTTLGGVKVDGSTITANAEGVISAIGGGGGGGSIEPLNWTKSSTTVPIPALTDLGGTYFYSVYSGNFGVTGQTGNYKGMIIENDWFDTNTAHLALPINSSVTCTVVFSNNTMITTPTCTISKNTDLNKIRYWVNYNPNTGLYEVGGFVGTESHYEMDGVPKKDITQHYSYYTALQSLDTVPIPSDVYVMAISLSINTPKQEGALVTQNGATFSLYVA